MRKTLLLFTLLLCTAYAGMAQSWDIVQKSDKYYYGEGFAETYDEAKKAALTALSGMIATNISSDFSHIMDETNRNGDVDHESRVQNYIKSSTQASLTNVKEWTVSKPPKCVVRCWVECSEVDRMFEGRIDKAKDYMKQAEMALAGRKLNSALKYYYWAYALVQSVQRPNEVVDDAGNLLSNVINTRMEEVLDDISVSFDRRDGNFVDFLFTYKGEPVSRLDFTYNNGQDVCTSGAKDGRGTAEVKSSHEGKVYHLDIEYEFKGHANGDVDMEPVLAIVPKKVFPAAVRKVRGQAVPQAGSSVPSHAKSNDAKAVDAMKISAKKAQLVQEAASYNRVMDNVIKAIRDKRYSSVANLDNFTFDGLEVYNELVAYGTARIVGVPDVQLFKGLDSCVVARGLQMSFSFNDGKKNFVEDVVFYFDKEGKIDNVAFGLGVEVTNYIFNHKGDWSYEAREILMSFIENYQTAYGLERYGYIESIFSDDAQIIVGKVVKRKPVNPAAEKEMSIKGKEAIEYSKLTKKEYLARLKNVFAGNEFININFSNIGVRKITKVTDREKYVIQLAQEYSSSRYSDKGYLMLIVDITDKDEPLIEIRTWQPDQIDLDGVFHEGIFYTN